VEPPWVQVKPPGLQVEPPRLQFEPPGSRLSLQGSKISLQSFRYKKTQSVDIYFFITFCRFFISDFRILKYLHMQRVCGEALEYDSQLWMDHHKALPILSLFRNLQLSFWSKGKGDIGTKYP
jgi:hypothetical protein